MILFRSTTFSDNSARFAVDLLFVCIHVLLLFLLVSYCRWEVTDILAYINGLFHRRRIQTITTDLPGSSTTVTFWHIRSSPSGLNKFELGWVAKRQFSKAIIKSLTTKLVVPEDTAWNRLKKPFSCCSLIFFPKCLFIKVWFETSSYFFLI